MATNPPVNQPPHDKGAAAPVARISPAMRNRLQRCYQRGIELARQEKPDFDYAHTMFAECVLNDAGNLEYVEAMLDNLQRKYDNNKRGSRFRAFAGRGTLKKAFAAQDWPEVFRAALEVLKSNPWDVPTLRMLAKACQANHYNEVELRYLKNALDSNPKDIEVNRHCAESLARMGQFDQAIACWHRVEELDRKNEEARSKISDLTLAKTLGLTGLEAGANPKEVARAARAESRAAPQEAEGAHRPAPHAVEAHTTTPSADDQEHLEELARLESRVAEDPTNIQAHVQLADRYTGLHRYRDALRVLKTALDASGGTDLNLLARLEDTQIRMFRAQVAIAEKRAASEKTEEAAELVRRFRVELNRQELHVFAARAERFPNDKRVRFDLALRLKREEKFREAAQYFDEARGDPPLSPLAVLEKGECLQHLKQYGNALKCYETAAQEAVAGSEVQKLALYRAAVLAGALNDLTAAQDRFRQLVAIDPNYRDTQARLDKLQSIRHKG